MGIAEQETVRSAGGKAGRLAKLLTAGAVRERCAMVHQWVAAGRSQYFALDESKLSDIADYVAGVTRAAYPDLKIPPHSRWRHFSAGGVDRWGSIASMLDGAPARERARAAIDLATVSVLLDAGAGDQWHYKELATGRVFSRSEGLAVASLDMFIGSAFSSRPERPLQVDAAALKNLDASRLAQGFQVDANNPLIGLDQRAALLRRLGLVLETRPDLFGATGRPGVLADYLTLISRDGRISAPALLSIVLESLASIWPSGLMVDGINVGDAGRHPAVRADDVTNRIVPFHKLSQWLTYSLIEPLAMAGLTVVNLDGLTALAEYRNGGLLIDLGLIRLRQSIETPQAVTSELVVEWRALTVTLMDQLLGLVRQRLGLDDAFALPHLLQGGSWSAGRKIALELRPPRGDSPIPIAADGTVF